VIRRIVGNLLFEEELAGRRPALSRSARETAAGAATLLRAFAREGDRLWTPAPVEPERLSPLPGVPIPELESGPLERLAPAAAVLAWGETPAVAAHRPALSPAPEPPLDAPLHDLLWHLPAPPPAVAAAVHHRAFGLGIAAELGQALPGARMVDSSADLAAHLVSGLLGTTGSWILKAPLSAAGRSRYIHRPGEQLNEPQVRRRIERLFARHGPLLFEPWMDRTEDFGCVALLSPSGERLAGFHRLLVDRRGQFAGIELTATFQGFAGLSGEERKGMEEALGATARALRAAGYTGPFGIDAWRYRSQRGDLAFQPLCEVNARMTFGLVARALVDRLRGPLGLAPGERVRLVLGKEIPSGAGVLPLLFPDAGTSGPKGGSAAWLELP
jgi:hypothetical protein